MSSSGVVVALGGRRRSSARSASDPDCSLAPPLLFPVAVRPFPCADWEGGGGRIGDIRDRDSSKFARWQKMHQVIVKTLKKQGKILEPQLIWIVDLSTIKVSKSQCSLPLSWNCRKNPKVIYKTCSPILEADSRESSLAAACVRFIDLDS